MKLRLANAAAHGKLAAALAADAVGGCKAVHQQENYFFDGSGQELSSKRVVLRVRFYNTDAKALITVKVGWRRGGWFGFIRVVLGLFPPCLWSVVCEVNSAH